MKRLALLLALCLPVTAFAQLELRIGTAAGYSTVNGDLEVGPVPPGESVVTRFVVHNAGAAIVPLTKLSASGYGFTMGDIPSLPYNVPPGADLPFSVTFTPPDFGTYSAAVTLNSATYILKGKAPAVETVSLDDNGALRVLKNGDTIDFGELKPGERRNLRLEVTNGSSQPLTVAQLTLAGDAFQFVSLPGAPLTLAPLRSSDVVVGFSPPQAGSFTGTLTIGLRTFILRGKGTEIPFPAPRVVVAPITLTSGMQARVRVELTAAAQRDGHGVLSLEFTPVAPLPDDPTVIFLASSTHSLTFDYKTGDTVANVQGQEDVDFQTGTTAGTLVVRAITTGGEDSQSFELVATKITVSEVRGIRSPGSLEIRLSGYDNTETISELRFLFFRADGSVIGAPISVNAADKFKAYFSSSTLGGIFGIKAIFPVTGDSSYVQGMEVELVNPSGITRSDRLTF